jgi:hypothetical protein
MGIHLEGTRALSVAFSGIGWSLPDSTGTASTWKFQSLSKLIWVKARAIAAGSVGRTSRVTSLP